MSNVKDKTNWFLFEGFDETRTVMMEHMGSTMHHMFTALEILLEVARERYRSPTVKQQREDMKAAAKELTWAISDWSKFVEALSNVADRFKFADTEVELCSAVQCIALFFSLPL